MNEKEKLTEAVASALFHAVNMTKIYTVANNGVVPSPEEQTEFLVDKLLELGVRARKENE